MQLSIVVFVFAIAGADVPCHHAVPQSATEHVGTQYAAPRVKLVDQHGKEVAINELLATSQPVVLNFIFTSCRTICPVLSASLASLHRKIGDSALYVSISTDPEYDTPPVLAEYAKRFDVGPKWTLLTGRLQNSVAVQEAFGADYGTKNAHKPLTFVRPAGKNEWTRIEGFPSTAELTEALGMAVESASR